MYHKVAKGVTENGGTNHINTWWKANFNMPTPDLWSGTWVEGSGPLVYHNLATSFDLTGFYPGWEIAAFFCGWHWEGPLSGTAYLYSQWRDENNVLMFTCANAWAVNINIASGYWTESLYGCNQGVAGWEVDTAGNYRVRSWSTGTGAIGTMDTTIAFSNVPSTTQLGSDKPGYIWVEGDVLCFICANRWKHYLPASYVSNLPGASKAGMIWIDTNNYLNWVGNSGNHYKSVWRIKQFASTWSNSASGEVYAGTDKKGMIWVDNEYGLTHLSYIGNDGYKYITGGGHYPYQIPY